MSLKNTLKSSLASIVLAGALLGNSNSYAINVPNYEAYTVQRGDNPSKIASKLEISLNSLKEANPSLNPKRLRIGQKINYLPQSHLNDKLSYSTNFFESTKIREGFSSTKYMDCGNWANGYGHKIMPGEKETVTEKEAEAQLKIDLNKASKVVKINVRVPLNQEQFDVATSLVYNSGEGMFEGSKFLKKLNNCDYLGAANELDDWVKGDGVVKKGLVTRRAEEKAMFLRDYVKSK